MQKTLEIIILAAGKGKRMKSDLPKPLHMVGGVPTIDRIIERALPLCKKPIIVIGGHSKTIADITHNQYRYVLQHEQRGTGHAILEVRNALKEYRFGTDVMVIPGDHPLVSTKTLRDIYYIHQKNKATITIGTLKVPNFDGDYECFFHYGRIKRDTHGAIQNIIETKDATSEEKAIHEVNVSYYCFNTEWLWSNIHNLNNNNAAQELYLTDMIRIAAEQNIPIYSSPINDFREAMGFNTPAELVRIERLA